MIVDARCASGGPRVATVVVWTRPCACRAENVDIDRAWAHVRCGGALCRLESRSGDQSFVNRVTCPPRAPMLPMPLGYGLPCNVDLLVDDGGAGCCVELPIAAMPALSACRVVPRSNPPSAGCVPRRAGEIASLGRALPDPWLHLAVRRIADAPPLSCACAASIGPPKVGSRLARLRPTVVLRRRRPPRWGRWRRRSCAGLLVSAGVFRRPTGWPPAAIGRPRAAWGAGCLHRVFTLQLVGSAAAA